MTWWHWWCSWELTALQHGRRTLSQEAVTVILDRCWCGQTRTRVITGQWTAEELGTSQE